jgi:hypothetical protein
MALGLHTNQVTRSCGDFTVAELGQIGSGNSPFDACSNQYHTTHNYCNKTPVKDNNGQADGVISWIKTNCDGSGLLPMDQQPTEYQWPGVSTGHVAKKRLKNERFLCGLCLWECIIDLWDFSVFP